MSFSFLGGLASLLPGYIQGQRMANQDNWSDLMNYNKAQQGQLSNMFTEATWQPRLDMFYDWSDRSAMQTANDWLTTNYNFGAMPTMGNQIYANNIASSWTAPMQAMFSYWAGQNAMRTQQGLGNMLRQGPWSQGNQQTPSGAI